MAFAWITALWEDRSYRKADRHHDGRRAPPARNHLLRREAEGLLPSEARAILTLSELERWLALQIAGVYQLSLHSSLGTTPLAAWQEAIGRSTSPVRKPVHSTEFFLSFLPAVSRQVRRDGIHLWNIATGITCSAHGPAG